MEIWIAIISTVLLSFLICAAIERIIFRFVDNVSPAYLMIAILGIPASGTVLSFVFVMIPSLFDGSTCAVGAIGTMLILLFIAFCSYYLCEIGLAFRRIHAEKMRTLQGKSRKRKKKV